jgi:hypothetical protein
MDERLTAMQRQLDTTKAQNNVLATRLRQLATAYRMAAATGPLNRRMPMRGGPGAAMPNLGAFAAGPICALSSLGRGTHSQRPVDGEVTGLFGRDQRASGAAARAVQYAKTKLGQPYVGERKGLVPTIAQVWSRMPTGMPESHCRAPLMI